MTNLPLPVAYCPDCPDPLPTHPAERHGVWVKGVLSIHAWYHCPVHGWWDCWFEPEALDLACPGCPSCQPRVRAVKAS